MMISYCTRGFATNVQVRSLAEKRRNMKRLDAEGEMNTTIILYGVEKCDYSFSIFQI